MHTLTEVTKTAEDRVPRIGYRLFDVLRLLAAPLAPGAAPRARRFGTVAQYLDEVLAELRMVTFEVETAAAIAAAERDCWSLASEHERRPGEGRRTRAA